MDKVLSSHFDVDARADAASASTPNNAAAVPTAMLSRALLACGVVAGPLFLLVVIVQALTRPGYDLERHPISLLTLGDWGWIQIANFIGSGLLTVAFAAGLRRALRGGPAGVWGPMLIGLYGVGLIVAGVFVPDGAWSFPPGAPAGVSEHLSWHAGMHGVGFVLAFVSATVACVVFARRDAGLGQRGWGAYAVASAVVAIALSQWPGWDGISVRYLMASVIVWAWTVVLALRLWSAVPAGPFMISGEILRAIRRP